MKNFVVKPLISVAIKTCIAAVAISLVFNGGSHVSRKALADENPTHSSEAHEQETQASSGQEQEQEDTTFEQLSQPNKSLSPNHFIPLKKMIGDLSPDVRLVNAKLEPWSEYEKELGGAIYNFISKDRMVWVVQVGHLKHVSYGRGGCNVDPVAKIGAIQTMIYDAQTGRVIDGGILCKKGLNVENPF